MCLEVISAVEKQKWSRVKLVRSPWVGWATGLKRKVEGTLMRRHHVSNDNWGEEFRHVASGGRVF